MSLKNGEMSDCLDKKICDIIATTVEYRELYPIRLMEIFKQCLEFDSTHKKATRLAVPYLVLKLKVEGKKTDAQWVKHAAIDVFGLYWTKNDECGYQQKPKTKLINEFFTKYKTLGEWHRDYWHKVRHQNSCKEKNAEKVRPIVPLFLRFIEDLRPRLPKREQVKLDRIKCKILENAEMIDGAKV